MHLKEIIDVSFEGRAEFISTFNGESYCYRGGKHSDHC
jgi:hypothetical protein